MSIQDTSNTAADDVNMLKRQVGDETEKAKCICVSSMLAGYNPGDLLHSSIKSIELSKLFSCKTHDQIESISQDVLTCSETIEQHYGMGMVVATDGSLYVASNDSFQQLSLANQQLHDKTTKIAIKLCPIVVEIKQRIYVLSAHPHSFHSDQHLTHFEVYDLTRHEWNTLKPPPFMIRDYYPLSSNFIDSYIVVGKYLCVSSRAMSFAFDTETEEWECCDLFSTYYQKNYELDYASRAHYDDYLEYHTVYQPPTCYGVWDDEVVDTGEDQVVDTGEEDEIVATEKYEKIGAPFPSVATALEYDGYLLCIMRAYGREVVAMKIVQGKVEEPEILLRLTDPLRFVSGKFFPNNCFLVGLGGGEFCLVARFDSVLEITKFKVVKKSPDGGLTCAEADVEVSTVKLTTNPDLYVTCYGAVAH